jgi:membrane-bound lytic murein transglycosylase MltF
LAYRIYNNTTIYILIVLAGLFLGVIGKPLVYAQEDTMSRYGQYTLNDSVAEIIRKEARRLDVPEWFALAIAGAESDWKPDACGDTHTTKEVVVGGQTYTALF